MTEKPYFSLFAPAIRSQYYKGAYDSVAEGSKVPFEMVFVGNVLPTEKMPDNFRYIYSEASPAECWEIGARESRADLLLPVPDDVRYSKNFLDKAYYYTTVLDMDKTLISFRGSFECGDHVSGVNYRDEDSFFYMKDPLSPVVNHISIYKKNLWEKLGGFDRRFYGSFVDTDIILRFFYELGMKSFFIPDCIIMELKPPVTAGRSLLKRSNAKPLLLSLWYKDGKFSRERTSPVESFIF